MANNDIRLSTVGLTDRQARFVQSYLQTGSISEASEVAGYTGPTSGYAALRSPAVQRAIHDYRERLIKTEGATNAYRTMLELLKPGNPGGVRFSAAKWILEAAGHGAKEDDGRDKPLSEMTEDELSAFIKRVDEQIAKGGEPPIITVTPEIRALPPGGVEESDDLSVG